MAGLAFFGFGGVEIAAETFGRAGDPAVLLVPSTGQTKDMWLGVGQALGNAGRYAVCIDLRGHGTSGIATDGRYDLDALAHDIRAVLAQLPSRAAVVGVGAGGLAAALAIGESAAPLASAVVLVGVTTRVEQHVARRVAAAFANRLLAFATAAEALDSIAAVHPFEPAPSVSNRLLAAFDRGEDGLLRWRGDKRALQGFDILAVAGRVERACASITVPTCLVRGTVNETVTAESVLHLQRLLRDAEVVEIGGAGHYVVTDREDAFNAVLLDFLERKAPRRPLHYESGSDPRVLRDALGCFGTGVTVVTTFDSRGNPIGLTANSFTSVSLEPPLILFCLAKSSSNLETFSAAESFAINILHIGQQPTSARFARRDEERFGEVSWERGPKLGSPILTGSLASFDCCKHAVYEGGDHLIFVGEVRHAVFEPHRDPLLFFRGKYRRLHFA